MVMVIVDCRPEAISMRFVSRLASAEFAFFAGLRSAGRAGNLQYRHGRQFTALHDGVDHATFGEVKLLTFAHGRFLSTLRA
jgi:hypothetical protein